MDTSPIVAVASSAGDLEAVSELLSALPAECRAAFIIVQHLDSDRERLLFAALGKRTILPVIHAHDGAVVEQDHVYVITANADRKSTRLNSSHRTISYAVFCLKKKSVFRKH